VRAQLGPGGGGGGVRGEVGDRVCGVFYWAFGLLGCSYMGSMC
jgi:hypothetical protein